MRARNPFFTAAILGAVATTGAVAQDESGEALYMNACAVCHGTTAAGDGSLAEFMNVPVPNLRQLSQRNDGIYPMLEVIQTIDGRSGIRAHGSEMPFWGNLFKADAVDDGGMYGSEVIVRGQMLSLALYLEELQEE
jgi:hypothetical protein